MPNFETRLKDVSRAADLEVCSNSKSSSLSPLAVQISQATDTANHAYVEGISNKDWVDDTLMRLQRIDEDHYGAWKSTRPSNVKLTDKLYRRGCKNRA